MAISEEWLENNRDRFDPCFESGREVREYLEEQAPSVLDQFVESCRYSRKTGGVFFRVKVSCQMMNKDYQAYSQAFQRLEDILAGSNASPH